MYALLYLSTADPIVCIDINTKSNLVTPHSFIHCRRQTVPCLHHREGWQSMDGRRLLQQNEAGAVVIPPQVPSEQQGSSSHGESMGVAKGNSVTADTAKGEKSLLRQNWALLFQFAQARRYLGELSLRMAASDSVCRSQLLEFLVEDGIVSKNIICRALSIDVLLRLVKTLKAEDKEDRLAPLLLKLLEYLSSLEDEADDTRSRPPQVYTSRFLLVSALATKELVKKVPPIADANTVVSDDLRNNWYCTHVFPAAYIGQFAATNTFKSSWTAVLDELPPTVLYSPSSLDAVLHAIALLLAHPAWGTRQQAARTLQAIFASVRLEAVTLMWPLSLTTAAQTESGNAEEMISWLCGSVESPHFSAWSIRKAIFQTLATVADRAPVDAFTRGKNVVENVVKTWCGAFGVADGRYSMVRVAAAAALTPLLKRAADDSDVGLQLVVQRERVSAAVETLLASEDASEQQAAFSLKSQLVQMP